MELTSKAKKLFEAWYLKIPNAMGLNYGTLELTMNRFYCLPLSMQWGIYQDFADSLGFDVCAFQDVTYDDNDNEVFKLFWSVSKLPKIEHNGYCNTRMQARKAAIKKLNEIINNS